MKTVVLYNIISFIIIVALIFVLRIVSKSNLRQNQQLVIKVIAFDKIVYRPCCDSPPDRIACICQDWDKKNFIFFCTYSIKPLLIFKVQNSLCSGKFTVGN